jgi:protein-S-isoprenylcysteine O-methyltransferase Ste14
MHVVAIVIGASWVVFWIYWLAAATTAKSGRNRWGQFAGVRVALIILVVVLLRLGVFKKHGSATANPWLQGIGLAIFLLGLALAIWARIYIGRNWGMPMTEKAEPELVNTGPYSKIRHPIYSGIILALVGSGIAIGLYLLVTAAIIAAYFIYSAITEERNLTKLFPEAYPEYKRSTKMLIPYIF